MKTTYDAQAVKGIFHTPTTVHSLQDHFQHSNDPKVEMIDAGTCYECVMENTGTVSQTAMKATLNPGGKRFRLEWHCSMGHKGVINNEEVYPTPTPPKPAPKP